LLERARTLAGAVPAQMAQVLAEARSGGLRHAVLDRLETALATRAERCLRALG
jgi:hypothetical protein